MHVVVTGANYSGGTALTTRGSHDPATLPGPNDHIAFTGRPINGSLLLTVSEAAAALRISRSSIYRLFESGELGWVQIGASRRVTSAEIHRFIAAHTEAASWRLTDMAERRQLPPQIRRVELASPRR